MTSASSGAVWFLYKLFSDLGIYYYFAGKKRAKEGRQAAAARLPTEILVCIPGGEGSVGMEGPATASLIVYVMWKNDLRSWPGLPGLPWCWFLPSLNQSHCKFRQGSREKNAMRE